MDQELIMRKLKKIMRYNKYSYNKWVNYSGDFTEPKFDKQFCKRYHDRTFSYLAAKQLFNRLNHCDDFEKALTGYQSRRLLKRLETFGYTDLLKEEA